MNKSPNYPIGAGPWGASPETISSWIGPKTQIRDIFRACIYEEPTSIEALNSFCISLGIEHEFYPDSIEDDLYHFARYLSNPTFMDEFSARVSNIIIEKLPEGEGENMRTFLENILFGRETPLEAHGIVMGDIETNTVSELKKDIKHSIESAIVSLGAVSSIYYMYIICRTLGPL